MRNSVSKPSTERFSWEGTTLALGTKKLTYELPRHVSHVSMYYCSTPTGMSIDFYNLSRARQHLLYLYRTDHKGDQKDNS